jgi:predicted nucleic acid-binding protein
VIVADTNAVAYLLIAGEKTARAQRAYDLDSEWTLPELWRHEFLSVLAAFVRQGGATLAAAAELWQTAVALFGPSQRPADMLLALQIAAGHQISAYDAQFVALAMEPGVPLITEDQALLRKFPGLTRPLPA